MVAEEATLERVSKAILEKARSEAEAILEKARKDAEEIINKAKLKRKSEYEREASKIIEAAKRKARAIVVQAILKTRKEITKTKYEIIESIVKEAKEILKKRNFDVEKSLRTLLLETIQVIPSGKVIVYANPVDVKIVEKIIKKEGLGNRVEEVIADENISGGVVAVSVDGKFKIDNSYDSRLEMVLSRLMPNLSRELFGE